MTATRYQEENKETVLVDWSRLDLIGLAFCPSPAGLFIFHPCKGLQGFGVEFKTRPGGWNYGSTIECLALEIIEFRLAGVPVTSPG